MLAKILPLLLFLPLSPPAFAKAVPFDCTAALEGAHRPSSSLEVARALPVSNIEINKITRQLHRLSLMGDQRLAPLLDPFSRENTLDGMQRVFKRLAVRKNSDGSLMTFKDEFGQRTLDTPAEQIRKLMNKNITNDEPGFHRKLIKNIITDSKKVIVSPQSTRSSLYSAAWALRLATEYVGRFWLPEAESLVSQPLTDHKQSDGESTKKDPPEEPRYTQLAKQYTPTTKDTEIKKDSPQPKEFILGEFNGVNYFYKQYNYNTVLRSKKDKKGIFQVSDIPTLPMAIPAHENTGYTLTAHTLGAAQVDLYTVPGYEVLQPADPRVTLTLNKAGHYTLRTSLHSVSLSLRPIKPLLYSPEVLEFFTRPVGFDEAEFPEHMRLSLFKKLKGKGTLEIATQVQEYIQHEFLYSVGPRPEQDPIAAIKAGAFQCDMAVYLMIGILRDIFHVPSRIAGGVRAKKKKSAIGDSTYMVGPGGGHVWIEVFVDGRWVTFDPTPLKKDRKDGKVKSDFEDMVDPSLKPPTDIDPERAGQKEQKEPLPAKEKPKKKIDDQGKDQNDDENKLTQDDLADKLEIGSLTMNREDHRNPFIERSYRALLRDALNPNNTRAQGLERISRLERLLNDSHIDPLIQIAKEAIAIFNGDKGGNLNEILLNIQNGYLNQDVNVTYQKINNVVRHLELFSMTLDQNIRVKPPTEIIASLKGVLKELDKLANPISSDVLKVKDFLKTLPPISTSIIRERYGLDKVGANAPTLNIALDLKNGKLWPYQLISALNPYGDFILSAEPVPEYVLGKTYLQDRSQVRGRDLVQTESVSDIFRGIRLQPNKSHFQNFQEGTLYNPKKRLEVQIPTGYGSGEDVERQTIVLYDTSQSMSGSFGEFTAGLIANFADNAASDIAPSGRPRHALLAMGFDTEVHTTTPVLDRDQAKNLILNYQSILRNTERGTEIQGPLIEAFKAIADAQKRRGEPLKKANIVIITDGEVRDPLDINELIRYRNAIDRSTPVEVMFIAIKGTNHQLKEFVTTGGPAQLSQGFYREFSGDKIRDLFDSIRASGVDDKAGFYSDKLGENNLVFTSLINRAATQARNYSAQLAVAHSVRGLSFWQSRLNSFSPSSADKAQRSIELWLANYRSFIMAHDNFTDRRVLEMVVDDFMSKFASMTGVTLENLTLEEVASVRHLLSEASHR